MRELALRAALGTALATGMLGGAAGCGLVPASAVPAEQVEVVLTFDDGPLAADLGSIELDSLKGILEVLERRELQAVFFVAAPDDGKLNDGWTDGLLAVKDGGHVLAYHAYDHGAAFWTDPFGDAGAAQALMEQDYRRLISFVDSSFGPTGYSSSELFARLFRLPYGGGITGTRDGPAVGQRLGWTCRGYALDSMDWVVHADVEPSTRDALVALAEGSAELLVLDRLYAGGRRLADRPVVDVLFHVNGLTAMHLDAWIDILVTSLTDGGVQHVHFDVPESYLEMTDPAVDLSALFLLLIP